MKIIRNSIIAGLSLVLSVAATSCHNQDNEFPDYQGGVTVYFANQYPSSILVLGDWPDGDNSLALQHKCQIFATHGGAYKSRDVKIDVVVDPTLVDNLSFPDGSPVKVMPENYYSLASTTLTKKKDYLFGTEVTLSDAFFADPDATKDTYVIPLRMTNQTGADHILTGVPNVEGDSPARTDAGAWKVLPQDYVLYCVKYVNPWDASYLRRGTDKITENGTTTTVERKAEYVEKDEVVRLTTKSLTELVFPLSTVVPDGESVKTLTCDLILKFDGDNCTISTETPGMTASGSGKFVKNGEKNSFGNQDRDGLYLEYKVDFGPRQFETSDILVLRSRQIVPEFNFNPTYNK
ncbi:MAG: DUF1735 domain-containing protein [Muribaculaceae bacterium]|nr:DUF1735 domain-containing protein [Muribaculaceae bacterium]MDE6632617.1 DUF1735 domain-containing protein [Muribaculaceae bacterium]